MVEDAGKLVFVLFWFGGVSVVDLIKARKVNEQSELLLVVLKEFARERIVG